ncbi:TauD/TfdA family dioxygenase [Halotia wernerae UHCC 0503]|nr:TauD/TfdA family dioxygenase [Halotia wernerae UHCC 0503]
MMRIEAFGNSTAQTIYNIEYSNIMGLPFQEVLELFKSCGLILFQGFGVTYEQMKTFAEKLSSGFVIDPTKDNLGSLNGWLIQLADGGTHHIAPHCENGSTPFISDVIWFCCDVPAIKGGETLFWNAVKIWEELSEPTKQLFFAKKVKYWRNVSVEEWQSFVGEGSTITVLKQMLDNLQGITYRIEEDQSIYMEYTCSAVRKTKYDGKQAFANSIMYEYQRQRVSLEDGSSIPDEVIEEIKAVLDKFTEAIPWKTGDLAMIDNTKFLHGRPALTDTERKIFTTQTYI